MTVYVDLLFFLNMFFDFNILLTVNSALKRAMSLKRIFISSLVGAMSTFSLFLVYDTFWLFVLKIVFGIFLCIIAFGLKDRKYTCENVIYFFMTSMVLGGFLYFFLLAFRENQLYNDLSYSYLFLILLSPLMLFIYQRQKKDLRKKQNLYPVKICLLNNQVLSLMGYLDTGNLLEDPITKKRIILVDSKLISPELLIHPYYVPYQSLNHHGLLCCIKIRYLEIMGKQNDKYLLGVSKEKLFRDGVSCVLHESCLEGIL